jgi:hypothetical protein
MVDIRLESVYSDNRKRKEYTMTKLRNELERLTNQDLAQLVRADIDTVSFAAKLILATRGVRSLDTAEIDNRLSDSYIKHLELKFA